MTRAVLITGDQLSESLASLRAAERGVDHIVFAEVSREASYVPHHVKKIALIFSAMRHFASSLEDEGHRVFYHRFDPDSDIESFTDALRAHCAEHEIDEILLTWPGEWRVLDEFRKMEGALDRPVVLLDDDRFLCSTDEFADWAEGRKTLRMEFFYREMRRRTGLLMDGDAPAGGDWNFDEQNREKWTGEPEPSGPMSFSPDAVTSEVLELVASHFDGFGELDGFDYAVTRGQARRALAHFVRHDLPGFGRYQDAMSAGEDYLFHSRLSMYINLGILDPMEVCRAVEQAWKDDEAPINSVEGFIRQVIGWREFMRGVYWLKMPEYASEDFFGNDRPLPDWYWSGKTRMRCLAETIDGTRRNAYAHHIQRLMITGNFALILGVKVPEICDWYLSVYADAYDWVTLPNTLGMVMFADGGLFASKPYAASGKYVQRMSDYCADCPYDVGQRTGSDACPFNALYWDFLARNRERLSDNHRMQMMLKNVERLDPGEKAAITRRANWIRDHVEEL
ncbi:MAG: cryptochrome/photolyase family protein [Wenzhouxiangellaceae bacterium]|nr:cryptochrome/photolyase family protein [Wenzhouxiangellaceae bacterium]